MQMTSHSFGLPQILSRNALREVNDFLFSQFSQNHLKEKESLVHLVNESGFLDVLLQTQVKYLTYPQNYKHNGHLEYTIANIWPIISFLMFEESGRRSLLSFVQGMETKYPTLSMMDQIKFIRLLAIQSLILFSLINLICVFCRNN